MTTAEPSDPPASIPTRGPWPGLRKAFSDAVESGMRPWLDAGQPYLLEQSRFALGRFDHGAALLRYLECDHPGLPQRTRDVLDIGTGNGGIAFAIANCPGYRVAAVDIGQNRVLRDVKRATGLPVRYALASGRQLPYAAESFDIVLLIETLEHVARPRKLGEEILRVLRPGGVCLLTTPARLRYVLAADPHYGIRGIAGLPNAVQRFVVDRIARRRVVAPDGAWWPAYDVAHLYWTVQGIGSLFPGPTTVSPLYSRPMVGGPAFSHEWWRRKLRAFLFDYVVITKAART
jgi:SAM-dependent methyltransferase